MSKRYTWETEFRELFDHCRKKYTDGVTDLRTYYTETNQAFLKEIGCQPREFFDFVEDYCDESIPTPETALLVAAVRRDYFAVVQGGIRSEKRLKPENLPARDLELGGFVWLPRILAKARAKLRGELDPEIMYCCGGDRAFLRRHDIHPADFLRAVWAAGEDDQRILDYLEEAVSG